MDDTWRKRLREMVEADGRSYRAISLAAGFGTNYVQQMLKDKKEPSFPRLAKVLSVLGAGATLYVTSGLRLTVEVEMFLRIALSLDDDEKSRVRAAIEMLQSPASERESLPGLPGATDTTHPKDETLRS